MRRREFIAGLGTAAAWPVVARAQQGDRIQRIGALMAGDDDVDGKFRVSVFTQALADVGWTDRNVRMDLRWGGGDNNRIRAFARELVGLQPDIILTNGGPLAKCGPLGRSLPGCQELYRVAADRAGGCCVKSLGGFRWCVARS